MGGTQGSFYADSGVYEAATAPTVVPLAPGSVTKNPAPSSFYGSGAQYSGVDLTAFYLSFVIAGGALVSSEWLFGYNFEVPLTFPENMAGSIAKAHTPATLPTALSLLKNGVPFGGLVFTGGVGAFSCVQTSFAVGDLLEVIAPVTPDNTLSRISVSLFGTRTS